MTRAADTVADALSRLQIKTIFAMSGNQLMPLFDSFIGRDFNLVHVRHEAAAVHMADGWGRMTGEPGIALVPAGPGFANSLAAFYTAAMSDSPLVVLSGHAPLASLGKGSFQEMPQAEIAEYFAKESWLVESAEDLAPSICRAFELAKSGRPGPVHVALPYNLLDQEIDPATLDVSTERAELSHEEWSSDILDHLRNGKKSLIVAGSFSLQPVYREQVKKLQDAVGVPVIPTESPRGANDPMHGDLNALLNETDTVLIVGKPVDFTLRFGDVFSDSAKIMMIHGDEAEIRKAQGIFGDRLVASMCCRHQDAVAALIKSSEDRSSASERDEWIEEVGSRLSYRPPEWETVTSSKSGSLHPVQVSRILQETIREQEDVTLVVDGGEFGQWIQSCVSAEKRMINGPSAAIGPGIPLAIAAQHANPNGRVIVVLGDGTAGFHFSELDTAVRSGAPIIAIIGNDARWNAEYQIQLKDYGPNRTYGCELLPTRYDKAAEGFGCFGANIEKEEELRTALKDALASGKPACLNVSLEGHAAPVVSKTG